MQILGRSRKTPFAESFTNYSHSKQKSCEWGVVEEKKKGESSVSKTLSNPGIQIHTKTQGKTQD
jgi:hypothetical protein